MAMSSNQFHFLQQPGLEKVPSFRGKLITNGSTKFKNSTLSHLAISLNH